MTSSDTMAMHRKLLLSTSFHPYITIRFICESFAHGGTTANTSTAEYLMNDL